MMANAGWEGTGGRGEIFQSRPSAETGGIDTGDQSLHARLFVKMPNVPEHNGRCKNFLVIVVSYPVLVICV